MCNWFLTLLVLSKTRTKTNKNFFVLWNALLFYGSVIAKAHNINILEMIDDATKKGRD